MDRIVIDSETGEILTCLRDGDRILRKSSEEVLKDYIKIPREETFTKLYHKVLPILAESNLTASAYTVFIHLACNLRYQSNVSKYTNGKLITRESLQRDLRLPEITLKRSIYSLIKEGLIIEARTIEGKVFVVNPYVVNVGDKVNRTIFDLFKKSKWARW